MRQKKITTEQVRAWRNGADGFLQWVKDTQPRVLNSRNRYEVFTPLPFQEAAIRGALRQRPDGRWQYLTIGFTMPRRHSKTVLCALLAIWRFSLWENENIINLANSENQAKATGFGLCRKIILNTPALLKQIGQDNIFSNEIRYPQLQSSIRLVANNAPALYGEKISCGWVSEIHAAQSIEGMQILSSSLGDTQNAWLLIDSSTDSMGGPLHALEQAQEDPETDSVYVFRLEYADLAEALEKSPPWIDRRWLKLQEKQLPGAMFSTQHLNRRCESQNHLFTVADVDRCLEPLPHPLSMEDLQRIAAGRTFCVGGGFDRAKTLSVHGDNTIWTAVAKIAEPEGEPHFYVLHQHNVLGSLGFTSKRVIQQDYDAYKMVNVTLEGFEVLDISAWATDRGLVHEVVHPTAQVQMPAFLSLHQIAREGRLHFSEKLRELAEEMKHFPFELKGENARFGKSEKFKDDRVFSLCWAVYSLRRQELANYTLDAVICNSKSQHAPLCYLRSGDMVLFCTRECLAHKQVSAMYNQHMKRFVDSEMQIQEFYQQMVKMPGVTSYKAI